jgi:hypothetical protein
MEVPCYEEFSEIDISPYCGVTQSNTIKILFKSGYPSQASHPRTKNYTRISGVTMVRIQMLAIAIIDSYTPRALHQVNVRMLFASLSVDFEEPATHSLM